MKFLDPEMDSSEFAFAQFSGKISEIFPFSTPISMSADDKLLIQLKLCSHPRYGGVERSFAEE
jgi:hypothetical protein